MRPVPGGLRSAEGCSGARVHPATLTWTRFRTWGSGRAEEILAIHEALAHLAKMDERQAHVVEMRFFGGLSVEETAEVLKISPQSVLRDWKLAKVWLRREIRTGADGSPQ